MAAVQGQTNATGGQQVSVANNSAAALASQAAAASLNPYLLPTDPYTLAQLASMTGNAQLLNPYNPTAASGYNVPWGMHTAGLFPQNQQQQATPNNQIMAAVGSGEHWIVLLDLQLFS